MTIVFWFILAWWLTGALSIIVGHIMWEDEPLIPKSWEDLSMFLVLSSLGLILAVATVCITRDDIRRYKGLEC